MIQADRHTALKLLPVQFRELGDAVSLRRGCVEVKFCGPQVINVLEVIAAAFSGEGMTEDAFCDLFPDAARTHLLQMIKMLRDRRLLVDAGSNMGESSDEGSDVFLWCHGGEQSSSSLSLANIRIAVAGVNFLSRFIVASLIEAGFQPPTVVDVLPLRNATFFEASGALIPNCWREPLPVPQPEREWTVLGERVHHDCLVATSDFRAKRAFRRLNALCRSRNTVFYSVMIDELIGYAGPMVVDEDVACFECLCARQNSHLIENSAISDEDIALDEQRWSSCHPLVAKTLSGVAALELLKHFGKLRTNRPGRVTEVNFLASVMLSTKVLKVPYCPVCSSALHVPDIATDIRNPMTESRNAGAKEYGSPKFDGG